GAFSGISNDALIIAGGANFPGSPPWEGGNKVWQNGIYVLTKQGTGHEWNRVGEFRLQEPAAYGVSIATPQGILCIGRTNYDGVLSDIFVLNWDPIERKIINTKLGSLPDGFEATGGSLIGGKVYVTGIVANENRFINIEVGALFQKSSAWNTLPAMPG